MGYVHPDLKLALLAALSAPFLAAAAHPEIPNGITRGQSPFLSVGDERAQADEHLAGHGRRSAVRAQPVLELPNERDAQRGQLGGPDERIDVEADMLAILSDR